MGSKVKTKVKSVVKKEVEDNDTNIEIYRGIYYGYKESPYDLCEKFSKKFQKIYGSSLTLKGIKITKEVNGFFQIDSIPSFKVIFYIHKTDNEYNLEPSGCVHAYPHNCSTAVINSISVPPHIRRIGMGSLILKFLEELSKICGYTMLQGSSRCPKSKEIYPEHAGYFLMLKTGYKEITKVINKRSDNNVFFGIKSIEDI